MVKGYAVALLVLAAGCEKRQEKAVDFAGTEASATGSNSGADPLRAATVHADQLLRAMAVHTGRGLELERLELKYVREDGTMDPQYGRFEATLSSPPPPEPADDPDRPLGAPAPARSYVPSARECLDLSWSPGQAMTQSRSMFCGMLGTTSGKLRCSVSAVWARAIEQGAPRKALATISIMALGGGTAWQFRVDDAPRNVSFSATVEDTCAPTVESPLPP